MNTLNFYISNKLKNLVVLSSLFTMILTLSIYIKSVIDTNGKINDFIVQNLIESVIDAENEHNYYSIQKEINKNILLIDKIFNVNVGIEIDLSSIKVGEIKNVCENCFYVNKVEFSKILPSGEKLIVKMTVDSSNLLFTYLLFIFLIESILILFFYILNKWIILKALKITSPISQAIECVNSIASSLPLNGTKIDLNKYEEIFEVNQLNLSVSTLIGSIRNLEEKVKEMFVGQAKFDIANQVAHDIRSPLAALNMAMRDLSTIPEQKRVIIRGSINRIQDIANDLLARNRVKKTQEEHKSSSSTKLSDNLVSSLLDEIITEKRMQFRSKLNINIELDLKNNSYGLFSRINSQYFKRVISNLINNSVEALETLSIQGKVQMELWGEGDNVCIVIKDNGKGIPPEILKKIGQQGNSFGKENGNGIGLHHAMKSISEWGGSLNIESEIGQGTQIKIILPKCPAPLWFLPKINIKESGFIVILDDDSIIHQIWDKRFSDNNISFDKNKILHFSTPNQIIEWQNSNTDINNIIYLFDYELLEQKLTGLDIIEQLNINKCSILVTSRYDDKNIIKRCLDLNIKIIPKSMAELVPMDISQDKNDFNQKPLVEIKPDSNSQRVYIDDDNYLRLGWKESARENGISLLTFGTSKELENNIHQINKQSIFYIDRELGEQEPKGEKLAKELFEKGFQNLYLATGYEQDHFPPMEWIKGFVSKTPPWEVD